MVTMGMGYEDVIIRTKVNVLWGLRIAYPRVYKDLLTLRGNYFKTGMSIEG
jgi:hypothetical protein